MSACRLNNGVPFVGRRVKSSRALRYDVLSLVAGASSEALERVGVAGAVGKDCSRSDCSSRAAMPDAPWSMAARTLRDASFSAPDTGPGYDAMPMGIEGRDPTLDNGPGPTGRRLAPVEPRTSGPEACSPVCTDAVLLNASLGRSETQLSGSSTLSPSVALRPRNL
jgi:hypothetical protein